jgi:hypothetical protein
VDDVTRIEELLLPRDEYEPPRLRELGRIDELTEVTDGGSVTVTAH